MDLGGSKNLKELPDLSMFRNLETLFFTDCSSLKKLHSSINLESLHRVDLGGCSRYRFFPDISTNISFLILNQTAIEQVPWWIENFTKLICLEMWECRKLTCISPNISKLKVLEKADFSNCDALTKASWLDRRPSHAKLPVLNFINCSNLDQEALIQRSVFKYLILPGGQVPSFFTDQATGNTLDIPLLQSSLSQQFLRFRVCLVVDADKPKPTGNGIVTSSWVCCHFTCKDGIPFGYSDCRIDIDLRHQIDNHSIIFDCCFPLSKLSDPLLEINCDQVDTAEIHFTSDSLFKIRRCGIRLSQTNQPCIPVALAHVQEGCKRKATSDLGNDIEHGEETERSRKRIRVTNHW